MPLLPTRKSWSRDRVSLLGNSSPPGSPTPFGTSDPNVVSMFHSVHVAGPTEPFDEMTKSKPKQKHQLVSSAGNDRLSSGKRFTSSNDELHSRSQRTIPEGRSPPSTGALQFVPAYEEATASPSTLANRSNPISPDASNSSPSQPSTSTPNELERGIFRRKSGRNNQVSAETGNRATPPSKSSNHTKKTPQVNKQSKPQTPDVGSTVSGLAKRGKGTRIAKLASMFSSRAVVKNMSETPATVEATPSPKRPEQLATSPPRSESSTGYVAWPGTQDKRGATVRLESSYEESDVGGPNFPRNKYQEELEQAVDRELTLWMDKERSDSSNEEGDSSPKRQAEDRERGYSVSRSDEDPADFHLTTAVANPSAAAASPIAPKNNSRFASGRLNRVHKLPDRLDMSTPLNSRISSVNEIYGDVGPGNIVSPMTDPWGVNVSSDTLSSADTSLSKTSSAYFSATNPNVIRTLAQGKDNYELNRDRQALLGVDTGEPQPPTEAALALKDHYAPPHRTYNAANTRGFRGLLDKTKDVPNLLDGLESDSTTSRATSTNSSTAMSSANRSTSRRQSRGKARRRSNDDFCEQIREDGSSDVFDKMDASIGPRGDASIPESDVFDGISHIGSTAFHSRGGPWGRDPYKPQLASGGDGNNGGLNLVLLGGGLTTIQTTATDFSNRITSNEFDENLTNSDYDQYGFAKIPGVSKMISSGRNDADKSIRSDDSVLFSSGPQIHRSKRTVEPHTSYRQRQVDNSVTESDSGSSLFSDPYQREPWGENAPGNLPSYYVHPDEMKKVLKVFRKWCSHRSANMSYDDVERKEDATKAFALSEMRSRIMEKDIERGLERRGGTTVVDDLVLTPHNRAALRVRDAVIVSKAWRDGASPRDVINTSLLTRRPERAFFIKRFSDEYPRWQASRNSREYVMAPNYRWEEVRWVDDTDFSQYRCHSLGPRHLKGFEMFTIGDCQSILLKLSNERCVELRSALNLATARQIEAEELMKVEPDPADGMMTDAEMTYLTTMEEVKTISHKLVLAEKAFSFVRDRIEKLVAKYEALLVRFANDSESVAASSVISYESSYYSDDYSYASEEDYEKSKLARRAQRAELRAELAAREALLARQEARAIREEKERELRSLQLRLAELQSESSAAITEREHSLVLARAITATRAQQRPAARPAQTGGRISKAKIDDVKKRFRDRTAAKLYGGEVKGSGRGPRSAASSTVLANRRGAQTARDQARSNLYRMVGEEMFQHLDFYERSLKAVEETR